MNAHISTSRFRFEQLEQRCLRSGNPVVSIDDVAYWEGSDGQTGITFIVRLSAAAKRTIQIPFATVDGTAMVADGDYASKSGTLKFSPGETAQGIIVYVNGDRIQEADETFLVVLGRPKNATLGDDCAMGTILDDDTPLPPPPPPGEDPPPDDGIDQPVYPLSYWY